MSAGKRRHIVNILRPTAALGPDGQPQGQDTVYWRDVPCSIETLNGRELEVARQLLATATVKVAMYGDPEKPLNPKDYIEFNGRRFEIGQIIDKQQNGCELELICGEQL